MDTDLAIKRLEVQTDVLSVICVLLARAQDPLYLEEAEAVIARAFPDPAHQEVARRFFEMVRR